MASAAAGDAAASSFFSNSTVAALLSTGLISLAPNLILLLFPNYASGEGGASKFMSLGQAVAAGGLLGDVFLHALPDAGANGETAGLWVLLGFTTFLVADVVIRTLDEARGHSHSHGKASSSADAKQHHDHLPRKSLALLNLAADCMHNFTGAWVLWGEMEALYESLESTFSPYALSLVQMGWQ
jgi:zinc transporter ZupT